VLLGLFLKDIQSNIHKQKKAYFSGLIPVEQVIDNEELNV
jgi:hypothetical protein